MNNYASYIIIFILILWLSAREKTVKPGTMWIMPLLWAYIILPAIQWQTAGFATFALFALCLILGLALGVIRGKLEKMRVRQDGSISVQGSFISILIFVGVLALRLAAEYWGKTHALVSFANALLFIPLGSVCARRYIIYQRYQALLNRRSM
ncbi:CcdC protein domain-containing protein [Paenibacillus sp.]|jgi:uncharacterized membrane protein|uniref:CcdC protein domain-containing protein n=1 Tax=Paenibacillus sp. TaxID=58172 RepID=UPI00281BBA83|nr:CcdC protein domain-containing protein [Paenibacillus sp.]MDR0268815.1 DUF1453 family protein [Paenibacillus sp.]